MIRRTFLKALACSPLVGVIPKKDALPPEDPDWVVKKKDVMGPAISFPVGVYTGQKYERDGKTYRWLQTKGPVDVQTIVYSDQIV